MKGAGPNWEENLNLFERERVKLKRAERAERKAPFYSPLNGMVGHRFDHWRNMRAPASPGAWSISMAIAWILWRGHGYVRELADYDGHSKTHLQALFGLTRYAGIPVFYPSEKVARSDLFAKAEQGLLQFHAFRENESSPSAIPRADWAHLRADIFDGDLLLWKRDMSRAFSRATCDSAEVVRIWEPLHEANPIVNRLERLAGPKEQVPKSPMSAEVTFTPAEQEVVTAYSYLALKGALPHRPADLYVAIADRLKATGRTAPDKRTMQRAIAKLKKNATKSDNSRQEATSRDSC